MNSNTLDHNRWMLLCKALTYSVFTFLRVSSDYFGITVTKCKKNSGHLEFMHHFTWVINSNELLNFQQEALRPSVPYFFAIFQLKIFKFWILREDYLSTRRTAGFFDPKPRSSGIALRLRPSQIKVFSFYFINF
jgi:hypothetical protein